MSTAILRTAAGAQAQILPGSRLSMPVEGAWLAHLVLGEDAAPTGAVTIELAREGADPVVWSGIVDHGDTWQGRQRILVRGGSGGLDQTIDRREHLAASSPVPALTILQDILDAMPGGMVEALDESVAANLAGLGFPRWDRPAGLPASSAVGRLARRLGFGWRVLDTGALWMGPETWPAVNDQLVSFLEDRDGDFLADRCAPDAAVLRPGTTVMGRQIQRVTYIIGEDSPRAALLYRSDRADIARAVSATVTPHPLSLPYETTVAANNGDGTLDLDTPDPALPELRAVRYRSFFGALEAIAPGTSVMLAFSGGREDGAFCWGAQQDTTAASAVALEGDAVSAGALSAMAGSTPVTFNYLPPGAGTPTIATLIGLSGKVTGPGSQGVKLR
ncbi:MAG TPA: hypothetical protein VLT47_10915 [Anaeromyxobacteraceae bacterium]|nr:hypothetical protein [Anaeromyxobacteraceae bacterium]